MKIYRCLGTIHLLPNKIYFAKEPTREIGHGSDAPLELQNV